MKHEIVLTRGDLTLRPLASDDGPALCELVDAAMWAG
ncbi:GNAT family N-acetyltransferase, partial [Micrococcus luteus]|nr:GNAT family N-acetyltransferase [Micrococcus luteus]